VCARRLRIEVRFVLFDLGVVGADGPVIDSVGAVGFHPTRPFVVSASGSRHFEELESITSDESDNASDMEDVEIIVSGVRGSVLRREGRGPRTMDNTVKLWTYDSM
jgi:hypothetical protein